MEWILNEAANTIVFTTVSPRPRIVGKPAPCLVLFGLDWLTTLAGAGGAGGRKQEPLKRTGHGKLPGSARRHGWSLVVYRRKNPVKNQPGRYHILDRLHLLVVSRKVSTAAL